MNQRKENRKYVVRSGIEPRTTYESSALPTALRARHVSLNKAKFHIIKNSHLDFEQAGGKCVCVWGGGGGGGGEEGEVKGTFYSS